MKTATSNFKELINNGCPYHYVNLYLGTEKLDVSFKSFAYYGLINSGDSITIGSSCASHVEFELYNQTTSLEDKEVQVKVGVEVDESIEEVSLGYFTITKPTNTDEISKYTAYDRMIKLENVYVSELANPTTRSVMNEIGTKLGYGFANDLTKDITLDVNKIKGYTYREIVGFISALYGANCVINDKGQIEFKWYVQTDVTVTRNRMYENGLELSSDTTFKVGYIKCATGETVEHTATDEDGDEITETEDIIYSVGNGNNGINLSNPFMTQDILNSIYNTYFANFEYKPCKVNMLGNVLFECGDIVTVDNGSNSFIMPIMNVTHTIDGGIITNIESVAQTETEQSISYEGPLVQKIDRVYHELLTANSILASKIQASNITTDYLEANYASIKYLQSNYINTDTLESDYVKTSTLKANYIDADTIKANYIDTAKLEADYIKATQIDTDYVRADKGNIDTLWVTDLMIKGDLLVDKGDFLEITGVKINGDTIIGNTIQADKLIVLGEDGLYYKLNVDALGESTASADEKYQNGIDGSIIVAESITAEQIKAGTITAEQIKANSITADELDVNTIFTKDITATGSISGVLLKGTKIHIENELSFYSTYYNNKENDTAIQIGYLKHYNSDDEKVDDKAIGVTVKLYSEDSLLLKSDLYTKVSGEEVYIHGEGVIIHGGSGVDITGPMWINIGCGETTTIKGYDIALTTIDSLKHNGNVVITAGNYTSYCAKASHGNHVPTTQTASNKVFLRNDNTWQTITPGNIGALATTGGTISGSLTVTGAVNSNTTMSATTSMTTNLVTCKKITIQGGDGASLLSGVMNLGSDTASDGNRYYINNKATGRFDALRYVTSKAISSRRFKTNIDYKDSDYWHDALMKIKPCTFFYKNDNKTTHIGLIAEDLYELIPELVGLDDEEIETNEQIKNPKPSAIEYANLTVPLVGEVQRLNNVIANQQQEIDNLKEQIQQIMKLLER